jgi:hypothetical protein
VSALETQPLQLRANGTATESRVGPRSDRRYGLQLFDAVLWFHIIGVILFIEDFGQLADVGLALVERAKALQRPWCGFQLMARTRGACQFAQMDTGQPSISAKAVTV